jgi:hypothetical protein
MRAGDKQTFGNLIIEEAQIFAIYLRYESSGFPEFLIWKKFKISIYLFFNS